MSERMTKFRFDGLSEVRQNLNSYEINEVFYELRSALESEERLAEVLEVVSDRLEHFLSSLSTEGDKQWILSEIRSARKALSAAGVKHG